MRIATDSVSISNVAADALIVPVFEGVREERFGAGELIDNGEVTGKSLELTLIHHPPGLAAKRVLLAGAGKPGKFDSAALRRLSGAALRFLKPKSAKSIAIVLEGTHANAANVSAAVEGAIIGDFEPDVHKKDEGRKSVDSFTVVAGSLPDLAQAAERGRILAEAQNFARDLVNEPANLLTPLLMAE